MTPVSNLITGLSIAVVSACIGAFLFLFGQMDLGFAVASGLGCFVLFYALQFYVFVQKSAKSAAITNKHHQQEMSAVMDQLAIHKRQIEKLEQDLNRSLQKIQAIVNHQLDEEADRRAVMEARIGQIEEKLAYGAAAPRGGYVPAAKPQAEMLVQPAVQQPMMQQPMPAAPQAKPVAPQLDMAKLISAALLNDSVDLCLAPIVTLPYRKPRFHNASLHVILPNGQRIASSELRDWPLPEELLVRHDVKLFQKLALIIPEFRRRSPETAFFANLHRETLRNGRGFSDILALLEANDKIVDQLIIGITNSALSTLDPLENATLTALRKQNLRFCVTDITTLRLDMDNWSNMGMRFAEIPASLLQDENNAISSDIVLADLPLLLRRFGVEIIVTDIHAESIVVEVLEYDVRYGRGYLFGAPRPVAVPTATPAAQNDAA